MDIGYSWSRIGGEGTHQTRFSRYAWAIVVFNIFVIIWGGFVSASGSGDGCGTDWPLCGNLASTHTTTLETLIEFSHRATSGLLLIFVLVMVRWAFVKYPSGHFVRKAAVWSTIFLLSESLLGAGLVIFRWVDTNESLARAFVQPIHLVNTLMLSGAIALTAWWASGAPLPTYRVVNRHVLRRIAFAAVLLIFLSSFGTIASLASTLFPSESFFEGVQQDFARNTHYLIRLRIWHPIIAIVVGGYLYYLELYIERYFSQPEIRKLATAIVWFFCAQFVLGGLNAVLLTPIWLQMVHLLMTHMLWLGLVLLGGLCAGKGNYVTAHR